MKAPVVATLVVPFGSIASAGGAIIAEWDDSLNVDDEGELISQWLPGDVAYMLVHHDATVVIRDVKVTAGTITADSSPTMTRVDMLGFADAEDKQSLQYLPAGRLVYDWRGNVGRDTSNVGKEILVAAGTFPCLAEISYPVIFRRYRLQLPDMDLEAKETFPVRVYVYYEEVAL